MTPIHVRVDAAIDAVASYAVTGLPAASRVAAYLGAGAEFVDGRLVARGTPGAFTDAVTHELDSGDARQACDALAAALAAFASRPPDLPTLRGSLPTATRTVVQAVLNVTPDSFSDGGVHLGDDHPGAAVRDGLAMVDAGADVVDVGGESTRPGADPVDADEEIRRVVPVVEALAAHDVTVSVDTAKARVARAAIDAGAAMVNDVSAGMLDTDLLPTVAASGAAYVLMHMRGTPRTMQQDPRYADVVAEVFDHLATGLRRAEAAGISRERVAIDPGIGFGKTVEHNVVLLRDLRSFTSLGRPVLIGASRKSFLGRLTGEDDPLERMEASIAAAAIAVGNGASIVRVHDVGATVRAVAIADAVARPQGHESVPTPQ